MPAPPNARLHYDDMAALRRDALELLESNGWAISWRHILERGHVVAEPDIRSCFYFGEYAPSSHTPGRYLVITHDEVREDSLVVVFEILRVHGGKLLHVVTAFTEERP